jgi:Flp pilus assembly protein TadD
VQGAVEFKRADEVHWQPLTRGQSLCGGDSIRVDQNARAGILLGGHTLMRLDQRTALTFPAPSTERTWLDVLKGALHFISRTPQRLEVETPFVNAAIEGTEFALRIQPARTLLWVYEGRVVAANRQGSLGLTSGEAAVTVRGEPPRPRVLLDPRDAVDWALYYPPLLDLQGFAAEPDRRLAQAVAFYRRGDLRRALTVLSKTPEAERDAEYFNLQGALLLSVGQVGGAEMSIEAARALSPQEVTPLALEAIIALTQNRKSRALELARMAVAAEPRSPVAHTALSYVQQARFDIEAARASARRATELSPRDALARARLAELDMASGDRDAALASARTATRLDPRLALTRTILGFAYLARFDIDRAREAFDAAIRRDQADPLPRLGRGLALIREGELERGRREIEIAASLDPSQSIIRSYLGKSYYDEKRSPLASEQFAMAKRLDPNDPTPWFYDAILKQTENRPVEALHDVQRSIELNDNRAVYRSRLLLDEDLAARSASQARIYRDLGFEQLALVEGWKSVNTDPASYSAHRLLADAYSTLPRHEIARVSELLQSQLLQPLNVTPVPPRLAEADLLVPEGLGPAEPAFNEFNPLFARDRLGLQLSGIRGSNDAWGDEVTQFGLWGPLSYSLGQLHFETDGVRPNNDFELDVYNAFAQAAISPEASVQLELRHEETESGDVLLHFDPDAELLFDREHIEEQSARVGGRYSPRPGHDIIASLVYASVDERPVGGFSTSNDAVSGEVRDLFRHEWLALDFGGGHLDQDGSDPSQFTNAYGYASIRATPALTATLGLSFDSFEQRFTLGPPAVLERDEINPKLGLIWNVTPATTLRAAAFSTVKRPFAGNQTLEPTQVAGFNQFFDDFPGSRSRRFGIGIDQAFSPSLFGGIETTWRDVDVPCFGCTTAVSFEDWDEQLHRAYLYWAPAARWAFSAEAVRERFERSGSNPSLFLPRAVTTHQFPLAASYYHPSGLFARLGATYVHQKVTFVEGANLAGLSSGSDRFWLADASVGYRLPNRWGILSLNATNLFDDEFRFEDANFTNPSEPRVSPIQPERQIFVRFTLSF